MVIGGFVLLLIVIMSSLLWAFCTVCQAIGCGEGCPPPTGEGSGEALCPLPRKFSVFLVENTTF